MKRNCEKSSCGLQNLSLFTWHRTYRNHKLCYKQPQEVISPHQATTAKFNINSCKTKNHAHVNSCLNLSISCHCMITKEKLYSLLVSTDQFYVSRTAHTQYSNNECRCTPMQLCNIMSLIIVVSEVTQTSLFSFIGMKEKLCLTMTFV